MTHPDPHAPSPPTLVPQACVGLVLALIALPELCIWAADAGWIGSPLWRSLSVQNGAFWPGLLRDWQPN
ncbi:MAG: rhomboid family intramembrane serine protease, partial [Planctomycetota bacterium]